MTETRRDDDHIDEMLRLVARNIAARRKSLGKSGRQAAEDAELPQTTFRYLEQPNQRPTSPTKGPTILMLAKVARGLGLEPWQLLVPDLDPKSPPRLMARHDTIQGLSAEELRLIEHLRAEPQRLAGALAMLGIAAGEAPAQSDEGAGLGGFRASAG